MSATRDGIKKYVITTAITAVIAAVITAAITIVFGIPAYNARTEERLKSLEMQYAEAKEKIGLLDDQTRGNSEKIANAARDASEASKLIDNGLSASAGLQERISVVEQSLRSISSTNPITAECAEIMRDIRQPKGMVVMSRDERTVEMINKNNAELEKRFKELGCSQQVQ
ncbi:MAG: hypothetical protein Q4P24_13670 [Rhodobacterales bacterium]|nr:hypothetical protein [Rhodobacterales bacterium]